VENAYRDDQVDPTADLYTFDGQLLRGYKIRAPVKKSSAVKLMAPIPTYVGRPSVSDESSGILRVCGDVSISYHDCT